VSPQLSGRTRPQGTQGLIETITIARRLDAAVKKAGVSRPTEQIDNQDAGSPTQD